MFVLSIHRLSKGNRKQGKAVCTVLTSVSALHYLSTIPKLIRHMHSFFLRIEPVCGKH
jgi:hypothetical protein